MEINQAAMLESFIVNWNVEFPEYSLTVVDLKKPQIVMGAVFLVFDRLGIDPEAIVAPPPEEIRNENLHYYWDLLPVINMTRVVNHLVCFMQRTNMNVRISHFLQPIANTSQSILFVLFNLMIFNESRLRDIQPYEEVLFSKIDEVKILEDKKNKLLSMLNQQAEEKGKRAERLEKLESEVKQIEEELKTEKEAVNGEQQTVDVILNENKEMDIFLEQKKIQRDNLFTEIEKKKALRVYDADDIRAQAEQAAQNVKDIDEKLKLLNETITQKDNSLMNLQIIKPNLEAANNLLHDIMKLTDSLRDYESGDLDSDSKEGELEVLNTELCELEVQMAEIRVARAEAADKRQEAQTRRQQERTLAHSCYQDAEEKDKRCSERCKKLAQRTQEIKELTVGYEQEKTEALEELSIIEKTFTEELDAIDKILLEKTMGAKKKIENKILNKIK